jgi:S1-C subfamily serine protease
MNQTIVHAPLLALSNALAGVVRAVTPAVVSVHSRRSRASGFVWRPGLIVTASDALADEGAIEVGLTSGERVEATLKGRDPSTDIALLRIDRADLAPVPPAAESVDTGSLAIVVGASEGAATAALGIVARAGAEWQSLRGGRMGPRIELDVAMRASAEGGVALDAAGGPIGMAVFGPRRRVLVIAAHTIERIAARLDTDGRIARGYLGLSLQPVRVDAGGEGAMVMGVDPAGPGASAGVRQGDVIVRWNGAPLRNTHALVRELGPDSVGSVVEVSATRAGNPVTFSVTIGARPDA